MKLSNVKGKTGTILWRFSQERNEYIPYVKIGEYTYRLSKSLFKVFPKAGTSIEIVNAHKDGDYIVITEVRVT